MSEPEQSRVGVAAALSAYLIWGLFPLYYHALNAVPAFEVLCHRVVWSASFGILLLGLRGRLPDLVRALTHRRTITGLVASGLCIATNWGSYIWAISNNQALDASLAYYALPLVTLALAMIGLGERLTLRQWVAVAIVALAVIILTITRGSLPWIIIILPLSFGLYSLLRKVVVVDALVGVTVEALLLVPIAAAYLLFQGGHGALATGDGLTRSLLLGSGPITTLPLMLFAFGARRMKLSSLGLLQYVNPTLQMVVAVCLLDEKLTGLQALTFVLIWTGLAIYSFPVRSRSASG